MQQYLDSLRIIMENGEDKMNRTGIKQRCLFGMQQRYDLSKGFPLVTTKKMPWKSIASELIWFIEGSNDERRLAEILHGTRDPSKSTIWTLNAKADYWKAKARFDGDLGRVYGVQWRRWKAPDGREIDQLSDAIEKIKSNPDDRRIIVSAWNPGELSQMALPPCHAFFQFFVSGNRLSLQMYQRSCDMFLGVPFNIASYSLLLSLVAQVTGYKAGDLVHTLGDCHIYHNHFDQVNEQLSREPLGLPKLWLNPDIVDINDFKMEDMRIDNYQSHPAIKAEMAV